jgi:hypothetical protein
MPDDALLAALVPTVAALIPELVKAIAAGDQERARQLAEEAAQRQAFEAAQRTKSRRRMVRSSK